jgi:hypothetical protein
VRATLGPLDPAGRIPALQQTRVAGFLMSVHGAELRLLASALLKPSFGVQEIALHAQLYQETEIVGLLWRATAWLPDPILPWLLWQWEAAWLPQAVEGMANPAQGAVIDAAAFGYALHTAIRPAAILPEHIGMSDPFAAALRRIELEGSRIAQAQLRFLKRPELTPVRDAIEAAVDQRHARLRQLWSELLSNLGVGLAS